MGTNAKSLISRSKPPVNTPGVFHLLRWAESYARIGWLVVPWWLGKEGEMFFYYDWGKFRTEPPQRMYQLLKRWAIIGAPSKRGGRVPLSTAAGLVVILEGCRPPLICLDADDPRGAEILEKLAHRFSLPFLFTRPDRSRGHLYMRRPVLDSLPPQLHLRFDGLEATVEVLASKAVPVPPSCHRKMSDFQLRWSFPLWHMPEMVAGSVPEPPPLILRLLRREAGAQKVLFFGVDIFTTRRSAPRTGRKLDKVKEEVLRLLEELGLIRYEFPKSNPRYYRLWLCPWCWHLGNPNRGDNPYASIVTLTFYCYRQNHNCPCNAEPKPAYEALKALKEMLKRRDEVEEVLARLRR